jgi:catechol 2,3-dioxygenase-like lactoylglutathione lyase family enzyme
MKLNHINLVVSNVADTIKLFETHFGFKCIYIKGDNKVAILKGTNDFSLVILKNKSGQTTYPEQFHIGFMLDSEEKVTKTYDSLKNDGVNVGKEPRKIRDSFGFYFNFDNIMLEVGHYLN